MSSLFTIDSNIYSTNLPDDVFEPGEVKPMRPLRKVAANGNTTAALGPKKRNASSEVCRDEWWIADVATIT